MSIKIYKLRKNKIRYGTTNHLSLDHYNPNLSPKYLKNVFLRDLKWYEF